VLWNRPLLPILILTARDRWQDKVEGLEAGADDYLAKPLAVATELDIEPALMFRGTEADLMELLGNLLDNAFKWCRARVRISAHCAAGGPRIEVADDGPGIDAQAAQRLLRRGARADETAPGHGIGLAVVREISSAYGGSVEIAHAPLGGALVRLELGDPSNRLRAG
jgi:two-component system sensor histidine kinase PhoQ